MEPPSYPESGEEFAGTEYTETSRHDVQTWPTNGPDTHGVQKQNIYGSSNIDIKTSVVPQKIEG